MPKHQNDAMRIFCYGNYKGGSDCHDCVYSESCQWYSLNPDTTQSRRGGTCSLEASKTAGDCSATAFADAQQQGLPPVKLTLRDLATFARYLLLLDDLTLGILQDIFAGKITVAEVAEDAGLSRQAVHRKMISDIARRPEISILYMALMPKLKAARRRLLRKKIAKKGGENGNN